MTHLVRVLLLICLTLGAAPALHAQDAASAQPEGTISVTDAAATDFRIALRIREILAELGGYETVRVSVRAGIVTLTGEVVDADMAARLDPLVARVEGVVTTVNEVSVSTDIAQRLNPALERLVERLHQTVALAPLLLVSVLAGALVAGFGYWLARRKWPWDRLAPNPFIADVVRQVLRLLFSLAAVVVALDILGATALLGTFLGAAGIVGLAIGFAVKDSVENFIASIMLSLRQPFRPNDLVEIEGDTGRVIRLTSRATILLSLDGNHIRIPNATVFKARIVNFTQNAERRFEFSLGVDSDADLARVREVGIAALQSLDFVLDTPPASGWIDRVGASNVEFVFSGWMNQTETDFALARSESIRVVKSAIEAAGFALPEPIYRVKMDGAELGPRKAPAPRKPAPTQGAATDTRRDPTLEALVDEERVVMADDLLNPEAPKE